MNNKIIVGVIGAAVLGALYFMTSGEKATNVADKSNESTKVGFVYLTTPGDHGWTTRMRLLVRMLKSILAIRLKQHLLRMFLRGLIQQGLFANWQNKAMRLFSLHLLATWIIQSRLLKNFQT